MITRTKRRCRQAGRQAACGRNNRKHTRARGRAREHARAHTRTSVDDGGADLQRGAELAQVEGLLERAHIDGVPAAATELVAQHAAVKCAGQQGWNETRSSAGWEQ